MGCFSYDPDEALNFRRSHTMGRKASEIFTASKIDPDFDPLKIKTRECRSSDVHPHPTPIILGLDVTGSMAPVLQVVIDQALVETINLIYEQKPVESPQIMVMGLGDSRCDRAPLQMTQFEADVKILKQLKRIYLEQGGGGNIGESYPLAWLAAAQKTDCDNLRENPPRLGYLFTIGDEPPQLQFSPREIQTVFGKGFEAVSLEAKELFRIVNRFYRTYHIILEEGNFASHYPKENKESWLNLVGEKVVPVADYRELAKVIVSIIQLNDGQKSRQTVEELWKDDHSRKVVQRAIENLPALQDRGKNGLVSL